MNKEIYLCSDSLKSPSDTLRSIGKVGLEPRIYAALFEKLRSNWEIRKKYVILNYKSLFQAFRRMSVRVPQISRFFWIQLPLNVQTNLVSGLRLSIVDERYKVPQSASLFSILKIAFFQRIFIFALSVGRSPRSLYQASRTGNLG